MPCYDYTNPLSSLFTNTEVTLPVNGTIYSFNSLYWICNFSLTTQLKVFKKNSGTNATVELILNTDFTINEINNEITILTSLSGYDQIIIQRATLSDQMITRFTEGAKLTAKDLNDCFHQLLFVTQEKDYTNSTVNINYSLATSVSAWTSGTSYIIGNIVSYNDKIYKCILATSSIVPTITTNWVLINPTLNGFYLTGTNSSIEFDLSNLSVGKALIWNGTKFVGSLFTGALNSLSDIDVDPVSNKDILVFDTSNSNKWTAKSPTVDITETNLKFSDKVFYPSSNTSWFNPINSAINISGGSVATALSGFKDNSNRWVLTDAPTVYHIVKKILPNETDPITFFNDVKTDLDAAVQNLTNPVKLKFYWNLNHNRINIGDDVATIANIRADDSTYLDRLGNFKSAFWHKPEELYNINGYDMFAGGSPLLRHGVVNSGNTYLTSPYFTQETISGTTTYKPKLEGYGIKAFYLSVPECKVTTIHLPVLYNSSGNYAFAQLSNIASDGGNLSKALATPGNEWNTVDGSFTVGNGYKDYYLMGLRDMAFAAARPRPTNIDTNFVTVYNINRGWVSNDVSRWQKSKIIGVWYSSRVGATLNQWRNINYKRFETSDSVLPVLWKIPDQIVYFNKCALANSIEGSNPYDLNMDSPGESVTNTGARALLRFTGYHRLQINSASNSSTSQDIEGLYYKANSFWQEFQNRWTEHTQNNQNYKYNEADIDWYLYNVSNTLTTPKVYRSTVDIAPFTAWYTSNVSSQTAAMAFPWIFRPNDIKSGNNANSSSVSNIAATGTGLYNIDANKLFSEADQFIEDPCDEFVYRIVSKTSVLNYLKETGVKHLKSSIILEHGFTDLPQSNGNSEILSTLQSQYQNNDIEPTTKRAWSRLFESKIKLYVKDEKVERSDGIDRYVITLVIRVPRLKSIGYAKIFRKWTSLNSTPPSHMATSDSNAELGPWTYDLGNGTTATTSISDFIGGVSPNTAPGIQEVDLFRDTINNSSAQTRTLTLASHNGSTTTGSQTLTYHPAAIGRNEAAVKFTSIGLPSNLWIRLSVLNTDGTTALLDGTNSTFGFTSSTFAN